MKHFALLSALLLVGCAYHESSSDFDRAESFVKTIDSGLFFIREIDSKGIFIEKEKPIEAWKKTALSLCPSGFKVLLKNDDDLTYQGISFSYFGGFVMATPSRNFMSAIDGVVLCNSSQLSEKEAKQKLIDEFYIVPE